MKRVYPALLALLVALAQFAPAQAQTQYLWKDYYDQVGGSPPEHFVFWKTYYYAMTPDNSTIKKGVRYLSDPLIWSHNEVAMDWWNALRPTGVSEMVESDGSSQNTDLTLYYSSCPGLPTVAGCAQISEFYASSLLGVRMWKRGNIWIRYGSPGYNWYTSSLRGVIAHEIGHFLGFDDQYSLSFCNSNYYGIMDNAYRDAAGYWVNCDVSSPTPAETSALAAWWLTGDYGWYQSDVLSNMSVRFLFSDNAFNDAVGVYEWKWASSSGGSYTTYATEYTTFYIGSHRDISAIFPALVNYPNAFGIHGKWIRVCTRPTFNYLGSVGTERCSPGIYYPY